MGKWIISTGPFSLFWHNQRLWHMATYLSFRGSGRSPLGGPQWWNDAAVMVVEKLLMGSARPRSLEKLVKDGENGQMPVRLLLIARFEVSFSWTWINGSTECREALWRHVVDWPQIGMVRFPHKGVRDQVYRWYQTSKSFEVCVRDLVYLKPVRSQKERHNRIILLWTRPTQGSLDSGVRSFSWEVLQALSTAKSDPNHTDVD